MNILIATLKEELATTRRLEKQYCKRLDGLPQGSFVVRTVRGKKYGYLTYRDGGHVRQNYLGALDEEKIEEYRSAMKERKMLKEKLKSVRAQQRILEKALRGKTGKTR